MASIVDRISLVGPVYSFEVFNDSLYCMGETISRIALPSKTFSVIAPGMSAIWGTVVDFHRPIDVGEDIVGHGAPDRRIYVVCTDRTAPDGGIGAIVPALGDQFTWNRAYESDEGSLYDPTSLPSIYSIAAAPSAKYLYIHDIGALTIAALDLGDPEPHVVASIDVNSYVPNMVISPDDRFIYAANPSDDTVRVIDTASWPPSTRKVTVANGPYGLALSADGKRLFVTGSGWGPNPLGTGTLSVLDTETMRETQIDIGGGQSYGVTVNSTATRAYVANSDGHSVSVVDVSGRPVVTETITGFRYPGGVRLSVDERQLYVGQNPLPNQAEIAIVAL